MPPARRSFTTAGDSVYQVGLEIGSDSSSRQQPHSALTPAREHALWLSPVFASEILRNDGDRGGLVNIGPRDRAPGHNRLSIVSKYPAQLQRSTSGSEPFAIAQESKSQPQSICGRPIHKLFKGVTGFSRRCRLDAYNAGDVETIVAMCAEAAVLMPPHAAVATGHAGRRAFLTTETAAAKDGHRNRRSSLPGIRTGRARAVEAPRVH